jgi:septation ring formation regulator EzrA
MSEDAPQHPREITLELIFRQGQRILGELGQIREKQDEIVTRLARVEREVVDLRRDILGLHEDYVSLAGRLDNLDRHVARIEHRLDLVDESTSPSN